MLELAKKAWFVRVESAEGSPTPFTIDFAVSKSSVQEAMSAALSLAEPGCKATSASQLSLIEIKSYRLRTDEVRSYGRRIFNSGDGRWVWDASWRDGTRKLAR